MNDITLFLLTLDGNYNDCITSMIKEFAKRSFEEIPIDEHDLALVYKKTFTQKIFDGCLAELSRMKVQVFIILFHTTNY